MLASFIALILLFSSFLYPIEAEAATNIVNPYQTYTYEQMVKDIKKLEKKYPDLIRSKVIGKSEYGRDIYAFSLGKGDATVFINGSHHAREWLTTNLVMYMAEQYAKAYKGKKKIDSYNVQKILNSTTIWFVPMVNPDGVTLQQKGLKAFPKKDHAALIKMNLGSKNFKRWKANAKGVDLNRQYDAGWKTIKYSPSGPRYKNYKGKAPHTAKETKAIVKFVEDINPEISVAYHSSGKIIYWNYKQAKKEYERDHQYAKKLRNITGYALVYPGKNPSGGGLTDWFIYKKKRPGFTIEISRYVGETNPPISEFSTAWKENKVVGLYIAQEGYKLFLDRVEKVAKQKVAETKEKMKLPYEQYSKTGEKGSSVKPVKATTIQKLVNEANQAKKDTQNFIKRYNIKNRKQLEKQLSDYQKYVDYAKAYIQAYNAGNNLFNQSKWNSAVEKVLKGNLKGLTVKGKDYSHIGALNDFYSDFDKDIQEAKRLISKVKNRSGADTRAILTSYFIDSANQYLAKIKVAAFAVQSIESAENLLINGSSEEDFAKVKDHLASAASYLNSYKESIALKQLVEAYYQEVVQNYEKLISEKNNNNEEELEIEKNESAAS